jgi:CheY-like chemotaxis protein
MMYFDLPLPAAERELSESRATLLSGTRILATDENATNRQLIREVLEQCGGEVELTSGGVETIRNLLDDPAYDCVILNASLPDLDGLATAAMIRSNRTVEHMPLVLMISSADPVEVKRARDLQVNAVLTKPVRRDVLVQAVARVTNSEEYLDDVRAREREGVVLVVEDNEVGLQLARRILRKAGYSVISARDGKEALEQMDNHKIDAVLMDIELPDMDGLEATSRIRHSNEWQDIPVIAMTAHAMKGDAERFLGAGVDCCLTKPVNQRELLAVVEQQLARRHPGCENAVVE